MKDINIVIVNWKMKDHIDLCLQTLFDDVRGMNLDIVVSVIDNSGNADAIQELLREKYPQVKYLNPGGNIGFGKAQNMGMEMVEAKYYLPLNPDVEFLPNSQTFARLIKYMQENSQVGIVGPKLLNIDNSIQESCYRFPGLFDKIARQANLNKYKYFKKRIDSYLMRDFDHNKTVKVDWVMGSFMFVKKEVVDKIGMFDDRFFMYFEDCDWCRRAWESGFEVRYVHEVVVRHRHMRQSSKVKSNLSAIFVNREARIHLKSWLQYFWKWKFEKKHYGI